MFDSEYLTFDLLVQIFLRYWIDFRLMTFPFLQFVNPVLEK